MANFNFNKVILGGRLTAEPELRTTQNGIPVASFSIAVSRKTSNEQAEKKSDFFNCTAWRTQAEFITQYFHKGSSICVTGTLQNRNWTDPQGVKHYVTDIVVDEVNFVDSKNDNSTQTNQTAGADISGFEELQSDDDLPFP